MALKSSVRCMRSKRNNNVSQYASISNEVNLSSSESESGASVRKNKVRDGFSIERLMKESECVKVDNDHLYSSGNFYSTQMLDSGRKRKISEECNEKPSKQKCFSKNAVMARLNRERKKKYVSSLESDNESLQKQNSEMKREIENQKRAIVAMRREILYLKGLLANSKELGQLLMNLNRAVGLPVTSSMVLTAGSAENDVVKEVKESEDLNRDEYQPRIRSVHSGTNFPILDKDINLGSCSDQSDQCGDMADFENHLSQFESDSYDLHGSVLPDNDSFCAFNLQNLDADLEESLAFENLSRRDPTVGICLHVNQKTVSLEICSICNERAVSSANLPDQFL